LTVATWIVNRLSMADKGCPYVEGSMLRPAPVGPIVPFRSEAVKTAPAAVMLQLCLDARDARPIRILSSSSFA
jgi:hypothetical protein